MVRPPVPIIASMSAMPLCADDLV